MAIRPIDMTASVHRTPEISRVNVQENARGENAQRMFAEQLQKDVRQNEQQVVQSSKMEKQSVNKDGKRNDQNQQSKKKKRPNGESETFNKSKNMESSSMLDITV